MSLFIIEVNTDLRRKNTYICFLELQAVSGAVSLDNLRKLKQRAVAQYPLHQD